MVGGGGHASLRQRSGRRRFGEGRAPAGTRPPALLLGLASLVAIASLVPVVYLGIRVSEAGWATVADTVFTDTTAGLLVRSLALAGAVAAASMVIGVGLAWLTVRCDLPGRRMWQVVSALPLAIPSYVAAFAYVGTFPDLDGFVAAWLVLTLISYPYVFLPVAAALDAMDPALEETARSLGSGPRQAFQRVTLRQLRPAAATGSLLVILYVLSDFGAVSILRFDSFTRIIYQSYQASFDRTPAVVLGCLLLVFTFLIVTLEARTRGKARYHSGRGAHRRPPTVSLGRARWPAVALPAGVAALALGIPAVTLVRWSVEAAGLDLDLGRVRHAAFGSLIASLLGAAATAVAALPAALLAARYRTRTAAAVERAVFLSHALPGIVVALSLVFLSVRLGPLYQRLPVLVFAYFVLFLPLAVGAIYTSAVQAPPVLEQVGRSLGRGPIAVFRSITVPLLAPGVAAGAALVFLTCMKELPATLLLGPTGFDTLATRVWSSTSTAAYGEAALPAFLLVATAAVPTWILSRRMGTRDGLG